MHHPKVEVAGLVSSFGFEDFYEIFQKLTHLGFGFDALTHKEPYGSQGIGLFAI